MYVTHMKRKSLSQLYNIKFLMSAFFPKYCLWMNSENNFADPEELYLWKSLQTRKQRGS